VVFLAPRFGGDGLPQFGIGGLDGLLNTKHVLALSVIGNG
jgi:hypothetical protein